MVRSLIVPLSNDGADAVVPEPLTNAGVAISLVSCQAIGPSPRGTQRLRDRNEIHHGLDPLGVVDLSPSYLGGDGKALTVSNQVEFAAESTSRAAQCVVFGLFGVPPETFFEAPAAARDARTIEPSMQKRSHSIFPSRSRRICRASRTLSYVPSARQELKYSYTVCQGPYRSGRSRQGAPVLKIQRTALSICRASRGGRPVLAASLVTNGAISAHCSSVTSCRCAIGRTPSLSGVYRQNGAFSDRA